MRKLFFAALLALSFVACGGDSGTSANDDNMSSSSSSSVIPASSGNRPSSSSKKIASSSSVKTVSSSSSVILSSSEGSSSGKQSSSSSKGIATNSSSSRNDNQVECREQPSTDAHDRDAESCATHNDNQKSSSSAKSAMTESSSSEYVPFDHSKTHAADWEIGENRYKTFVDPRNGRSYYYITIPGRVFKEMGANGKAIWTEDTVTVMAENLNIGKMVLGENDQNDDGEIERYCYNNDTTYCDEFGGLYQWAEMMQLPSRCNTESCADLIQPNHQGICPDGWRLFTWDDYLIIRQYNDEFDHGIEGLRSQCFNGYNTSGFSLIGAGYRTEKGAFESLANFAIWNYPQEYGGTSLTIVNSALVSKLGEESPAKNSAGSKLEGVSVRCVKQE